ncbi:type 1 glutamine amidotransferase [Pseudoalteromonas sp. TAB23]|uniref:type 1 glutamine amidotransferase n=1 Tax=Pseudoalteromonas sp. TAB23 TaxID=1938595 RepID=UPI0004656DBA|nr:type 1 glutamine amidotransferase [Pseudoalteromonas sp. TAB23]
MKIGILICGDVPDALKQNYGNYSQCLIRELGLNNHNELYIYNAHLYELPESVEQCDVYIISGSPASICDEFGWVHNLILFTREAFVRGKKLLGICFGHQLINHALGGTLIRSKNGWGLGVYRTNIHKDYLGLQQGQKLSLFSMHQDQVIKPPKEFKVIAGSDFCVNYITCYQDQILTIQGHPEFSTQFFLALIHETKQNYCDLTIQKALKSSKKSVDSKILNTLIGKFIKEGSDHEYETNTEVSY